MFNHKYKHLQFGLTADILCTLQKSVLLLLFIVCWLIMGKVTRDH